MRIALLRNDQQMTARTAVPLLLSAAEGASGATRWIQVAKVGQFKNYFRAGKKATLAITKAMLAEMATNFTLGQHPEQPTEIPVDYEHLSAAPSKPEDGKAAGWFKKLELRDDGDTLYAQVEWTDAAASAIDKKEFKYFSPEFALNYTTHDGDEIGCTLLAGALTNRPFLQGMEAVELRGFTGDALLTNLSFTQRMQFVERALRAFYRASQGLTDGCSVWVWAQWLDETTVAFQAPDNRTLMCGYTIDGAGDVTLLEPFEECVLNPQPLRANPALRSFGGNAMKTFKLRTANNEEVEIPEAAIEQLEVVKELRVQLADRVPKADVDAVKAEVVTLTGRLDTLSADNAAAKATLAQRDAKDAVDGLITARRATPGQRESLTELFLSNRDLFTKVTASMTTEVAPAAGELGHGKNPGDKLSAFETATAEVAKLRTANPQLSEAAAQSQVFATNPALYAQYVAATEQKVGKVE